MEKKTSSFTSAASSIVLRPIQRWEAAVIAAITARAWILWWQLWIRLVTGHGISVQRWELHGLRSCVEVPEGVYWCQRFIWREFWRQRWRQSRGWWVGGWQLRGWQIRGWSEGCISSLWRQMWLTVCCKPHVGCGRRCCRGHRGWTPAARVRILDQGMRAHSHNQCSLQGCNVPRYWRLQVHEAWSFLPLHRGLLNDGDRLLWEQRPDWQQQWHHGHLRLMLAGWWWDPVIGGIALPEVPHGIDHLCHCLEKLYVHCHGIYHHLPLITHSCRHVGQRARQKQAVVTAPKQKENLSNSKGNRKWTGEPEELI